jgi:tetratricopeptide (TPR) repeat protein
MPCAAVAVNRPSISARLSHAAAGLAAALLAAAAVAQPAPVLQVAQASAATQPAGPVAAPGQIGVAEPLRPTLSVPYDNAIAEYRAGRTAEALALAERALLTDPRNPQLRFLRGVVLTEQRRLDLAIEAFGSLIADFPELPEPYNNLAVIHADRGDWNAARQALEQSIRAVPTYALAHENLGDIHLQLAARSYEQAGRLDPRNESARDKLGLARELIGRIQSPATDRNPRPSAQPQVNPR